MFSIFWYHSLLKWTRVGLLLPISHTTPSSTMLQIADCHWQKAKRYIEIFPFYQCFHLAHERQWRIQGGGEHRAHSPPLELSNALLLGRGLAVATYISLTSHLLPPESRLLASYRRTDRLCVNNIMWPHLPLFYIVKMCPPLLKILNPPLRGKPQRAVSSVYTSFSSCQWLSASLTSPQTISRQQYHETM